MSNWWLAGGICMLLHYAQDPLEEPIFTVVWLCCALVCWVAAIVEVFRR